MLFCRNSKYNKNGGNRNLTYFHIRLLKSKDNVLVFFRWSKKTIIIYNLYISLSQEKTEECSAGKALFFFLYRVLTRESHKTFIFSPLHILRKATSQNESVPRPGCICSSYYLIRFLVKANC